MSEDQTTKPVSAFTLFTKSKDLVMKNYETYGLILLIPFLTSLFSNIRSSQTTGFERVADGGSSFDFSAVTLGFGAGIGLLVVILYAVTAIMNYRLNLEVAAGKKPTLGELWPTVQKFGLRLIGLGIVTGLVVVLGFIALILPGLIMLRRYFLSPYVMIDQDLSVSESMRESARIAKTRPGSIWSVIGVSILISLPSLIPRVGWIVSFALTALYSAAPALRYFELKKLTPKA